MPRMAKPGSITPTLRDAKDWFGSSLRAENKAPKTIRTYLDSVAKLENHVTPMRPIDRVSRADHEALFASMYSAGLKASSVSTCYRSLRSFWKFVVEHADLPVNADPMNGMKAPTIPEEQVEFLSDADLRKIIASCKSKSRHNYLGHRDEAIIRLLASTGARLSEVAELRMDDLDLTTAYPSVRVMGKGRRERDLPLDDETYRALKLYLTKERPRHPAAMATDKVWLARAGAMTANGIAQMFAERGIESGVTASTINPDTGKREIAGRRLHPHELRHRFISHALKAGLSEGDVMSLSGHRSRSMLDRYGRFTRAQRAHDAFRKATATGAIPRI